METAAAILKELESMGSEQTKKTLVNHGGPENMYGVKVSDMKTIVKRVKKNYQLALDLYNTGNSDAMYLAGLIGDETKMTKADLNKWAKKSNWSMISEYTVPFVASETPHGWELGLEWINSNRENIATAGWGTLSGYISITPDEKLDIKAIEKLLHIVEKDIHTSPNRVRYTMNGFVIAVGCFVKELHEMAMQTAKKLGTVHVNLGNTSCKVPDAVSYIEHVVKRTGGKKRKSARC